MRSLSAITGTFLIAYAFLALPSASRANGMPPRAAAVAAGPMCPCPPVVRKKRPVRHVRHKRRAPPRAVALAPPPYNPLLPHELDSAYDRGMVLHFRSAAVTGIRNAEPGYPPTPPIAGVLPYRVQAYGGVYQYDGLTGQYVRLAQRDAVRSGLLPSPPPPPPPPPVRGERG